MSIVLAFFIITCCHNINIDYKKPPFIIYKMKVYIYFKIYCMICVKIIFIKYNYFYMSSLLSLSNISHISRVALGLASAIEFCFISSSLSGFLAKVFKILAILSSFFIHIATLLLTKNSAFSSSCPGIGFIIIIGRCDVKLSVKVNPSCFSNYNISYRHKFRNFICIFKYFYSITRVCFIN